MPETLGDITVAIPTYRRGAMLAETLGRLAALHHMPAEVLLLDQTPSHPPEIEARILACGLPLRWLRLAEPGIARAMNVGLRAATTRFVLFLDDDIEPTAGLVQAHARALDAGASACAGMVLLPGERPGAAWTGELPAPGPIDAPTAARRFAFRSSAPASVANCIACNFSVDRQKALAAGGFDERFAECAFRFESEFAARFVARFGPIRYEPAAAVRHLRLSSGGVRATATDGSNARNDFYYALRTGNAWSIPCYLARRLLQRALGREARSAPAAMPARISTEFAGLREAWRLSREVSSC